MGKSSLLPGRTESHISREEAWERVLEGSSFFRFVRNKKSGFGVFVVGSDGEIEVDLGGVELVPRDEFKDLPEEMDLRALFSLSVNCET